MTEAHRAPVGARRLGELLARSLHASVAFVRTGGERTILAGNGATGAELSVPVVRAGERLGEVRIVGVDPAEERLASAIATLIAEDLADASPPTGRASFHGIVGDSPPMATLVDLLRKVATSSSTALLFGENGTGKERCARAIHEASTRRSRRFVAVSCSALNDNLLDSEFFGHKRGAFTGAVADRPGLLALADGGTFLLDEVSDMSPAMQVKLLRFLEEGAYLPVGAEVPEHADVRILAASNRDLGRLVERGAFREDLYYRLDVITIRLPPLRERRQDVPMLAAHFLRRATGDGPPKRLSDAALDLLVAHHWPGNVRELENEIERLVVLAGDERTIEEPLLSTRIRTPETIEDAPASGDAPPPRLHATVESVERRLIADALRRHGGNKTRAAKDLGVSRRNLIRLVRRYHLQAPAR